MRTLILVILLLIVGAFMALDVQANTFKVTIHFPRYVDLQQIRLYYDNGRGNKSVKVNANDVVISDVYISQYVSVEMGYPSKSGTPAFQFAFFVTSKEAEVKFRDTTSDDPFLDPYTTNIYPFSTMGESQLNKFIAKEVNDYRTYYNLYQSQKTKTDSMTNLLFAKSAAMTRAKLDFVKKNGNLYFSFWLFRNALAGSRWVNSDTMYQVFNRVFPAALKVSEEGKEAIKNLDGVALTKGKPSPDFSVVSIKGERFSSSALKGKYILLDFWASWCAPCLEELPVIRQFSKTIDPSKLKIISITLDSDSAAFVKAVKKHEMNWTHIYHDKKMIKSFGAYFVPAVFLIDPNGKLIYNRQEEVDYPNLKKLSALIEEIKP